MVNNESGKIEAFVSNPVVRALMQLVPGGIGSAADVLIMDHVDRIKQKRLHAFFEALQQGDVQMTTDLLANDDFLHCLDATLRAAVRARRYEKISLFARLLDQGFVRGKARSVEDYEDLVSVLDDLSYREWQALLLLDCYLADAPPADNPLLRVSAVWDRFVADLDTELCVEPAEASSFMNRIARTGLYNEITGAYWDYTGGKGAPTPKLSRLKELLQQTAVTDLQ